MPRTDFDSSEYLDLTLRTPCKKRKAAKALAKRRSQALLDPAPSTEEDCDEDVMDMASAEEEDDGDDDDGMTNSANVKLDDPHHIVVHAADLRRHSTSGARKRDCLGVPIPPNSPQKAYEALNLTIYYLRSGQTDGLNLNLFNTTHATSTIEEFQALNFSIPIAIIGVKKGETPPYPFIRRGWTWITPSLQELVVLQRLQPKYRNFSPLILKDRPAHLYIDLDCDLTSTKTPATQELARRLSSSSGPSGPLGPQAVAAEFQEALCAFFQRTYGRQPDLTGMWWLTACTDKKVSLHAHCSSEVFLNAHEHMKGFIVAFQSFLIDSWTTTHPTSLLCAVVEGCDEAAHLLDSVPLHGQREPAHVELDEAREEQHPHTPL